MGSSDIMENDIISLFLNRKKQNISRYTEVLAQYTLNNSKLNKILNKIVDIYVSRFYLEKNIDFTQLTKYFEIANSNESVMKDVLLSAIIFYNENGIESQIEKDIKTIVILSNLIFLAVNLDIYTSEFTNNVVDIEERLQNFFNEFKVKIKVADELMESLIEEITAIIKKDINVEKKFWKSLINNNYNLYFCNSLNNENLFKVSYEYELKMLNRYDEKEVEKISLTKGIIDDIYSIYLEELTVIVLKRLLSKKYDDIYMINIDSTYFDKNKNLINLDRIFSNNSVKKRITFVFDAAAIKDNISGIKYLSDKGYKLGLTNITEGFNIGANVFDMFDYIFISSDLLNLYKEYEEVWKIKNINFVIDNQYNNEMMNDEIFLKFR